MKKLLAFIGMALCIQSALFAQTPGLIIRDGAGNIPPASKSSVLDKNQNGWVSTTASGFVGGDVGATYSAIPYWGIPIIYGEPTADLSRGPIGGYTELVKDANGVGFYLFYDGTNFMVRLRVGSIVSGSKGYSVLLDTDGKFGPTGPNADPDYQEPTNGSDGNPGFEYEVVYESNFRVAVYFVNNGCASTPIKYYDLLTNPGFAQTSVALTNTSGDPDYFYDFYVPLSDLNQPGYVVTSSTPVRAIATTVTSPQGATCGPKSDVYGDDSKFGSYMQQWLTVIGSQPPFTMNNISASGTGVQPPCTASPVLNSQITTTSTSISGTWTKAAYSTATTATITVYKNGTTVLGSVTATSGVPWSLSIISGAVAANDIITAYAVSAGETSCNPSNSVRVLACLPADATVCPTVSICYTGSNNEARGISGTGIVGATIRIYRIGAASNPVASFTIPSGGTWGWEGGGTTGNSTNPCTGSADVAYGTYYVTQQEPGKCESIACTQYCIGPNTTATPTVNQSTVYTGTLITGTAVANARVFLSINNLPISEITATAGGAFSFNLAALGVNVGDVINIVALAANSCVSATVTRTVQCYVSAPAITADGNGRIAIGSNVAGTSAEPAGTTITVYNGSTNAILGTATVQSSGTWTSTVVAAVSTSYYARHTATACGTSAASATVSTVSATSATRCGTITSPILENANSVSGNLTSALANTTVTLFIDGAQIGSVTTNTAAWSIPVNTTIYNRIYAGGEVTITIAEGANLAANCSNKVIVNCVAPATPVLNPAATTTRYLTNANGTVNVTVTNSSANTFYWIELDPLVAGQPAVSSGISIGGNGGSIVLTSGTVTAAYNYTMRVVAFKPGTTCQSAASFSLVVSDTDGDGVADYRDNDDDNDGIPDINEGGDTNAAIDSDGDGILNFRDADYCTLNAKGVCASLDKDGDGIINQLDLDSDNDGLVDLLEAGGTDADGNGRIDGFADTDGDGLANSVDTDNGGTALSNADTDGDGIANIFDLDSDNDGIVDNIEVQSTAAYVAPTGTDTDNDGIDNAYDNDAGANRALSAVDSDADGTPDYRDTDSDNDAKPDSLEGWDTNGNGVIDGAEKTAGSVDTDGDGILDGYDNNIGSFNPTNSTTPASYPDVNNTGGDRDWRDSYITIAGYIWNDTNGDRIKVSAEPFISGSSTAGSGAITTGSAIYMNLVDLGNGKIVSVQQPTITGSYSLTGLVANRNYRLIVSTTQYSVGATAPVAGQFPTGWASLGENRNGTTEAVTPGIIDFNTNFNPANPTASLSQLNQGFSLNRIPTTNPITALFGNAMTTNTRYPLGSYPFIGTDPEDDANGLPLGTGATFQIMSLPNPLDAILYYDGSLMALDQVIPNYDPDLLEVVFLRSFTAPGVPLSTVTFDYRIIDNSGVPGNNATYTISLTNILPVSGLVLKAGKLGSEVSLSWETRSETNTRHFIVERSSNPGSFSAIAEVAASGNSSVTKTYQYADKNATGRMLYYRVKLVDMDGKQTVSNIVSINTNMVGKGIAVYPNPASSNMYLVIEEKGTYRLQMMTTSGQMLWAKELVSQGNGVATTIQRGSLDAGVYWIKATNVNTGVIQFVKVCLE